MQDTHRQPFLHFSSHLLPRQLTFKMPGYFGARFVTGGDASAARPCLAPRAEQDVPSLDHWVGQRQGELGR